MNDDEYLQRMDQAAFAASCETGFIRITSQGLRESHLHDVMITQEAPNYRAG